MISSTSKLTVEEFFELPEGDLNYELIDGRAIAKMAPKFFHSRIQKTLLLMLENWAKNKGRVEPEWAIKLEINGADWVPVPDLSYTSYNSLSADWILDEACPVAPELAIEIISPGQTFGDLAEKATDYLKAGVAIVWLIDTKAQTITVFYPDTLPQTFRGISTIKNELLPELTITPQQIFKQAGLA
jgi:Uma2 family endonuclease